MIEAKCRTNLNGFDCSKANLFVAVPNIGDNVVVLYRGNEVLLKVCSITHRQRKGIDSDTNVAYIEVELTGKSRE